MDPHSPLGPLDTVLSKSFRLGRVAGIEVRVFWTAVLVLAVAAIELSRWPGVGLLEAVAVGLLLQGGLYVVVLVHELGHALVGRRLGMSFPTITLSALGGLAHGMTPPPGPRAEALVSLAGPATHAFWVGLALALGPVVPPLRVGAHALPLDVADWLLTANLWMLGFNLLPFFPMDGGRVLRAVLAMRMHPNRATTIAARVGAFGAIAILATAMSVRGFGGTLLLFIGLSNLLACLRELAVVQFSEGPYGAPADPWATDPDAWKSGGPGGGDAPSRSGWFARWRRRRRARLLPRDDARPAAKTTVVLEAPPAPRAGRDEHDAAELDRLLEKVSEVGLAGLSDDERERLRRISEARRRT